MKKLTTTIAISFLAIMVAFAQTKEKSTSPTVVIVHGSWSSASDWDAVAGKLKADGNQVSVVNLPAHLNSPATENGKSGRNHPVLWASFQSHPLCFDA